MRNTHTHTQVMSVGPAVSIPKEMQRPPDFAGVFFVFVHFSCNKGVPRVHSYEESELGSLFSSVSTYKHTYTLSLTHTLTLTHTHSHTLTHTHTHSHTTTTVYHICRMHSCAHTQQD
jgi:hypothetical protein